MKQLKDMTLSEIYLEYALKWEGVRDMSDHYGVEPAWLDSLIKIAKQAYNIG